MAAPRIWTSQITKEAIKNDILMSVRAPVGPVNLNLLSKICIGRGLNALRANSKKLNYKYLFQFLKFNQDLIIGNDGAIFQSISRDQILNIKIPLPPMNVQEKIVTEIERIEKEEQQTIDKLDSLKQSIFDRLKALKSKGKVSSLCKIRNQKINPQDHLDKEFINIGLEDIETHTGRFLQQPSMRGEDILSIKHVFKKGDVLYGKLRPYLNKVATAETDGICSTDILVLQTDMPQILKYILLSNELVEQTSKLVSGLRMPRIKPHDLMKLSAPMPDDKEQKQIAADIGKTEAQIAGLQEKLSKIPAAKDAVLKKHL